MKPSQPRDHSDIHADEGRLWLSALADGESQALDPACEHWRDDADARRDWYAYQLIGDVMRSEDLASEPQRDAAFMNGLRKRLAQEAVVLAPTPVVPFSVAQGPSSWSVPAALVAGFVLVAGVLLVARLGPSGIGGSTTELAAASAAQSDSTEVREVANGQSLIVDPRLDEFLRVHQSAGGSMAAPVPGGNLRRVDVVVPGTAATPR